PTAIGVLNNIAEIGAEPVTVRNRTPARPTACLRSIGTSDRVETSKWSAPACCSGSTVPTTGSAMLRPLLSASALRWPSVDLQVFLELPVRHVVGETLQLVPAHDGVRLDELTPQHVHDLWVALEVVQRFLEGEGELLLSLVLFGGRVGGRLELELVHDPEQAARKERRANEVGVGETRGSSV